VTQLMKSLVTGGVVTAALILVEHYVLRPHLTTEPQRCAARAFALNAGVGIGATILRCPEAALIHVGVTVAANATTYGACWLDARVAAARTLAEARGAAAAPWPPRTASV